MEHLFPYPKMGSSFLEILHDPLTRKLLGFNAVHAEKTPFITGVTSRLKFLLADATNQLSILKIGYTALEAFLQANCTGPPLDFAPEESVFPQVYRDDALDALKEELFEYLSVDGSRPYPLTPHIELFWLAKVIMANSVLAEAGFNGRRARFRIGFWHQKLLSEEAASLRDALYSDADILEQQLASRLAFQGAAAEEHFVEFLIERAVVRTHYGNDALARADLARAATTRQFQFALTGVLGKRTKFQDRDISQLVVLAKSRDQEPEPYTSRKSSRAESVDSRKASADIDLQRRPRTPGFESPSRSSYNFPAAPPLSPPPTSMPRRPIEAMSPLANQPLKPENLLLNDDTLLERIHFKSTLAPVSEETMTQVVPSESSLPPQLASLDPAQQPLLYPMDSIILLTTAGSISNTAPSDGLVREETLPYATRVLEGGSSNWQVYTQALLVRSRIEGYRSRTAERGLLQLQALVDQVIAETSETATPETTRDGVSESTSTPSTFLPKPSASESASVAERLQYVYQLSPPLRWELEAELAARWTHMGGLKTALEIYERLQMHAEVALCLAATDQEDSAVKLVKGLLFVEASAEEGSAENIEPSAATTLKLRSPPPADSPRLLCILGDITSLPAYYTLAWNVSSNRYARAQRSLARHYTKNRDLRAAAEAYSLALNISRIDRASRFSLGCVQLELEDWQAAAESFTACVQLDDKDAEAWSNLAVALLRLPHPVGVAADMPETTEEMADDEEAVESASQPSSTTAKVDSYQHVREALRALRRAATLKRDDARIWDNYLTVAASIPPSAGTPWNEIVQAMGRVIELRGKKEGEKAVDLSILKVLVEYVTDNWVYPSTDSENEDTLDKGVGSDREGGSDSRGGGLDTQSPLVETSETKSPPTPSSTPAGKLPYTPRSLLSLIDTLIAPLATSSATLYTLLSDVSLWRHRPSQSLSYAEKAWRAHSTSVSATEEFDNVPEAAWAAVVDKTVWLMRRYADLGPQERERTGGVVEARWRFKARSAGRRVLGRGTAWEDGPAWERLKGEIEAVKE